MSYAIQVTARPTSHCTQPTYGCGMNPSPARLTAEQALADDLREEADVLAQLAHLRARVASRITDLADTGASAATISRFAAEVLAEHGAASKAAAVGTSESTIRNTIDRERLRRRAEQRD